MLDILDPIGWDPGIEFNLDKRSTELFCITALNKNTVSMHKKKSKFVNALRLKDVTLNDYYEPTAVSARRKMFI